MDFSLSEEQLMVQKTVHDFAKAEVEPLIQEYDQNQEMPPLVLKRMAELGILGLCLPVKYGGQGFDYVSLGLACEELEAVDSSLRVVMSVHMGLSSMGLFQWGTGEQKETFLVPQAKGEQVGCFGLSESEAGSDVASIRSTARKDGGDYVLNGEKMWISLATKADTVLWFGRTNHLDDPHENLSAFIVNLSQPGVSRGDIKGKLGIRAGSTGWISFDDVRVPESARIGEEGEGFKIAMSCLDNGRFTVAAGAAGLTRACLEICSKYANERKAFGKVIGKHQLIQQKIAHMVKSYQTSRWLYLYAGWLKNEGVRNSQETSLAKWHNTEESFKTAVEAVQLHGAYGYSAEYNVERYLRNAKGGVIYEGTSEIHQLIQAGYALGYRHDSPLRCELPAYDADYWQS